ncbi:HD domain-containing phosphohydrolase [Vibrio lentus]|uniref:Phosphohydrolase n=1 Tax=Vibrio lentus TaxID=136468 RepID=A0AA44VVA5_9VIBR|nr:HD domain-containing phosphohydrolase [Vibrio lentus]MCB5358739.1 transporter substrate-binding domain-containing protein [Vibrio lentus]MCB5461090.1 transporter substrate-binding domain-containing protein [Vibrio lentus]MCC4794436.1 transporter substrate-binding domain-containing protein [Vibrio lentus]MCC4852631.1 transporter substrate-binding domain-containing protein [Vibrio lentus]MCC5483946.1 transporter substrate-binding domain-containing protein [Vibrio lentus]
MTNTKISLRFTVGGMFLLATVLTAIVAVSLQYYFSKKMATEHTLSKLTMVSQDLSDYIGNVDSDAINTARLLSSVHRSISHQISREESRGILSEAIKDNPLFYSIYIGSSNERFFQIINLESSPFVRDKIGADSSDRWVVIEISDREAGRIRTTKYYDLEFNLRESKTEPSNYFPTTRPWYESANTETVEKTQPYLFQHLQITGQTYSLAFESKAAGDTQHVIGIDIVLSSLASKLSASALDLDEDSQVESFLYSKSGNIIASNRDVETTQVLPQASEINWSSEQQAIIEKTPPLLFSNQNDWGPMDFSVSGEPHGYAIDLLKMISEMSGVRFEFVNGFSWAELTGKFQEGSIDGLHSIQNYESNGVIGLYTDAIYELPFSVVTRGDVQTLSNYAELEGEKVAILSGWSITPQLRADFPNIELVEFSDMESALDAVENGEYFAVLDAKPVLSFSLDKFFHANLKVNEALSDLKASYPNQFHIVLQNKHQQLLPIINQAINALTEEQKAALSQKWFQHPALNTGTTIPYTELYERTATATTEGEMVKIVLNGEAKRLYLKKIETGAQYSEYFAVAIPEAEIYSAVNKRVATSIGVTVLLMSLTLPVAWIFGAPIVRPIRQLKAETSKIKQRDYDSVTVLDTRIKEIWELSVAVKEMSTELKQHEQTQEAFVESFIKLIAQAIDDKSAYTAGHCNRVPELGLMLADAAEKSQSEHFKDFKFENDDERREFRIAAWLHDCGKITTPEHIVDKGTKLEANYNRIHEVRTRFEVLWRDAEITALRKQLEGTLPTQQITDELAATKQQLQDDFAFIATSNVGGEFMSDDKVARIRSIAETTWTRNFDDQLGLSPIEAMNRVPSSSLPATEPLLSDKPEHIVKRDRPLEFDPKHQIKMDVPEHLYNLGEVYNLSIARGTLTAEDRFKINEHMLGTIKMLENLPFPKELSRVPRYASTHHETLKGTGYPRKLTADDLSIPERILVISDIFEALTAADRPYKKAKPISVAVDIMYKMALDEHLDIELFRLFLTSGTHIQYAEEYLKPEQIDFVDINKYLEVTRQIA